MKVVFMGSPEFAIPSLEAVAGSSHEILEVVTQPDRPRGRGRSLRPSPVGERALALGLELSRPERFRDPEVIAHLEALGADAFVVVAYGELLRKKHLAIPPRGCVNVHPSLLPRHRGAIPIQAALLAGDAITGVTTMRMDRGLDTGDMLLQRAVPVTPGETAGSLHDRLAALGASLLVETLDGLEAETITPIPQDDARATVSGKLTKDDGRIDWSVDAITIERRVRAMTPWPGATTRRGEEPMTLLAVEVYEDMTPHDAPGTVVDVDPVRGPLVGCGRGVVVATELTPAGSRPMSGADYLRGRHVQPGEVWG